MTDFVIETIEETDTSEIDCSIVKDKDLIGVRVIDKFGVLVAGILCNVHDSYDMKGKYFVDSVFINTNNDSKPFQLLDLMCEYLATTGDIELCFGCVGNPVSAMILKEFCNSEMWFEDSDMVFFVHKIKTR